MLTASVIVRRQLTRKSTQRRLYFMLFRHNGQTKVRLTFGYGVCGFAYRNSGQHSRSPSGSGNNRRTAESRGHLEADAPPIELTP